MRLMTSTEYSISSSSIPSNSTSTLTATIASNPIYDSPAVYIDNSAYSYNSDLSYPRSDYTNNSIPENSTSNIKLDLLCSISGSTSISHSIQNTSGAVPSWIGVDNSISSLKLNTPMINVDSPYSFSILSTVNGFVYPKKASIKIIDSIHETADSSTTKIRGKRRMY